MANICLNYLKIAGPKAVIKTLYQVMTREDNPMLFGYLRPEPDYSKTEVLPTFPQVSGIQPVTTDHSWYDWRLQNWGTTQELSEEMRFDFHYEEGFPDYAAVKGCFETEGTLPRQAVQYFADANPGVKIQLFYYESELGFCGIYDTDGDSKHFSVSGKSSSEVKAIVPQQLQDIFNIVEDIEEAEASDED